MACMEANVETDMDTIADMICTKNMSPSSELVGHNRTKEINH